MAINIIGRDLDNVLWGTVDDVSLGTFSSFVGFLECLKRNDLELNRFTKEELYDVKTFDKLDRKMIKFFYEGKEDDMEEIFQELQKYGLGAYMPAKVLEWDIEEVEQTVDRGSHDGDYYEEEKEWEGKLKVITTRGVYTLPFEYSYLAVTDNGGEGGNLAEDFRELVKTKEGDYDEEMIEELHAYFEDILGDGFREEYLEDC